MGWLRNGLVAIAALCTLIGPGTASARLEHDGGGWIMLVTQGDLEGVSPKLSRVIAWLDLHA